jgi:hypothetical protein
MQKINLSLCASLALSACGPSSTSTLQDLATPGTLTGPNEILWQQGSRIVLGSCASGAEPMKSHCPATHSGDKAQLENIIRTQIASEREPLLLQKDAEILKLRNAHPKVIEARAILAALAQDILLQDLKIQTITSERVPLLSEKSELESRVQSKRQARDAVQNQILEQGSNPDLDALRQRLLQEIQDLEESLEALGQELSSLESRLTTLSEGKSRLVQRQTDRTESLTFTLKTLEVSSELTLALDARMQRLKDEEAAWPGILSLIGQDFLVYRSLELNSERQALVQRLLTEIKKRSILPFREDFSAPLDSGFWQLYRSREQNINQVENGSLRMDSADGGINEAILELPLAGQTNVYLNFFQLDSKDNETPLPDRFAGHSTGDGVAISRDGQTWYTVLNAFALNTPDGQNFSINLDTAIQGIRQAYDVSFALASPFYIKFQQYEAASRPDARFWDNIEVSQRKPLSSLVRLSPTGILEVNHQNEWRDVCDDDFDAQDAAVACRALGGRYVSFTGSARGSSSFWLDDLGCSGMETDLMSCSHPPVGMHNCSTGESVRLECAYESLVKISR